MDSYVYPQSNVLINKMNIQDEQQLITVETQLLVAGILDLESLSPTLEFNNLSSIQKIHEHLFQMIYEWAGSFRTVNMYKSEPVLNGLSITYCEVKQIRAKLKKTFDRATLIDWRISGEELVVNFSEFMAELWQVHPYREGNTRMTLIFMKLFADEKQLQFNEQLLSNNMDYLRNAFVLATVDESPEPEYLQKLIRDALGII